MIRHTNCHSNRTAARRRHARRAGFTLIEIMVVVVITAIVASAASLTLLHSSRSASLDDVIRRVRFLDQVVRHSAIRSGHGQQIVVNLDDGTIAAFENSDDGSADGAEVPANSDSQWTQRLGMPKNVRMERAWVTGNEPLDQSNGTLVIGCSTDGYTPTYALQLALGADEKRWLIVAGLSGQSSETSDQKQVMAVLNLSAPTTDAGSGHVP